MPDNDVHHYLCSRCNAIFPSYATIDRTRPVRCTGCCIGSTWDDETIAARLGGVVW